MQDADSLRRLVQMVGDLRWQALHQGGPPGMQEHGKLVRLKARVAIHVFEPLGTVSGFAHHSADICLALRLI
jgi:hypothetical protein